MSCTKELLLSGNCYFGGCEEKSPIPLAFGHTDSNLIGYSPEYCFLMCSRWSVDYSILYIDKYDPSLNTFVNKATINPSPGDVSNRAFPVYDTVNKKFAFASSTYGSPPFSQIYIFDPATETITDTIPTIYNIFGWGSYVPEKGLAYFVARDAGGDWNMISFDFVTHAIVNLLNMGLAGNPGGQYMVYSPVSDAFYGMKSGYTFLKYSFPTNIFTSGFITYPGEGAVFGLDMVWDSDRHLMVTTGSGHIWELDTATDTIVFYYQIPDPNLSIATNPIYIPSLHEVFAGGYSDYTGGNCLMRYETVTQLVSVAKDDYGYFGAVSIDGASVMTAFEDITTFVNGFRRLCLT